MSLGDWLRNGWITEQKSSRDEIRDLLAVVERDLHDCRTAGLSSDWRFNIAYNAALQAATAALAAAGFRAAREAHHVRVIQSLAYTLGLKPGHIRRLDAFRKKRNLTSYEIGGSISEQEAEDMAELAEELRNRVRRWLKSKHPTLL
jgi:HEPN domain-containing protein